MKKLEIKEVQIDKFNDTYNQLEKFDSGLNLICGQNEAGKTTLMEFIANIFKKNSNADGYIKCNYENEEIILNAKKSKQKENIPYLEKVTSKNFEQGFIINLDNLSQVKKDSDLLDIIKDSSGTAINEKQEEYSKEIKNTSNKFYFTNNGIFSTKAKIPFNKIQEIEETIDNLQSKEKDYNALISECEELKSEIDNLKEQTKTFDIQTKFLEKQDKLKECEQSISEMNINFKLIENKSEFDKIREKFYSLKTENSSVSQSKAIIENLEEKIEEDFFKLNSIENIDNSKISEFNTSLSSTVEKIQSEIIELENNKKLISEKLYAQNNLISEKEIDLSEINQQLSNLKIDDISSYIEDKEVLKKYYENYNQKQSKLLEHQSKNTTTIPTNLEKIKGLFSIIFIASILFIAINQSLLSIIFCLISITISIIGFKNSSEKVEIKDELKDQLQKELEEHKSEMKSIIKKYKQESLDKEISVITPCLIEELETKISKYNELSEKKSKILNEIKSKSEVLKEIEENKQEILQSLENAKKEEQEFLDKVSISNLKNYNEVATIIRGIRANTTKLNELKTNQSDIDTKSIDFVENINKFIETTEIDTLPKLCKDEFENFETSIKSIQKLIEENSTNKTLFDTLNSNKEKLKQELSEIKIEPDNFMSKEEYDFLNNSISEKQDRLAIVTHEIEQLKQVESLINIKNFKTAELNKLKNELYTLFINKMVYEIIQSSKEEFNKIQPNLVSAKNFLKTITNGKYTEINFDRKTISGENTPEKEWSELSRGTKEQLYLSLRLGYAQNYSKTNNGEENGRPNLPLIIDDAFVNFDKARTTAILECLKEFSNTNQVLFFTCHTEAIKGILDEKEIEYKQIEL